MAAFVAAIAAAAVGCGSSTSTSADPTEKFVGDWTFNSGSVGGSCFGQTLNFDLTAKTFTLTKTGPSTLLFVLDSCQVTFTVSGTTATADPAQTCMLAGALPVTVSITDWTFVGTDGLSLTSSLNGSVATGCPVTGSGVAAKSTPTDGSAGG